MGFVRWKLSCSGRPYFSLPRVMLFMRKVLFLARVRMICSPSASRPVSPGGYAVDVVSALSGGHRHTGNGEILRAARIAWDVAV